MRFENGAEFHEYLQKGFEKLGVKFNDPELKENKLARTHDIDESDLKEAVELGFLELYYDENDPQKEVQYRNDLNKVECIIAMGVPFEDATEYEELYPDEIPEGVWEKYKKENFLK